MQCPAGVCEPAHTLPYRQVSEVDIVIDKVVNYRDYGRVWSALAYHMHDGGDVGHAGVFWQVENQLHDTLVTREYRKQKVVT